MATTSPSIKLIRASDGSGNASAATVQNTRSPGATTIQVDTVQGIPDNFYASMGTPHTFTDPVTGETITVISEASAVDFEGHVDGTNLEIDDIAAGYTDNGSAVGDIVIIRPVTSYANNIADVLDVSHNDDGTPKAWPIIEEAWTFNAWNATTKIGVINVPTGATSRYREGNFIKFVQSTGGTKYGRILSVATTTITVWIPDYTLNNEAITSPSLSWAGTPFGISNKLAKDTPYRFSAYRTAAQGLTDSALNTIVFSTEEYDYNSNYDASTGVWTAPVAGVYQVYAQSTIQGAGTGTNMLWEAFGNLLYNNTTVLAKDDLNSYDNGYNSIVTCQVAMEIELAAGDTLRYQMLGDTANSQPPSIVGGRERNLFKISLKAQL